MPTDPTPSKASVLTEAAIGAWRTKATSVYHAHKHSQCYVVSLDDVNEVVAMLREALARVDALRAERDEVVRKHATAVAFGVMIERERDTARTALAAATEAGVRVRELVRRLVATLDRNNPIFPTSVFHNEAREALAAEGASSEKPKEAASERAGGAPEPLPKHLGMEWIKAPKDARCLDHGAPLVRVWTHRATFECGCAHWFGTPEGEPTPPNREGREGLGRLREWCVERRDRFKRDRDSWEKKSQGGSETAAIAAAEYRGYWIDARDTVEEIDRMRGGEGRGESSGLLAQVEGLLTYIDSTRIDPHLMVRLVKLQEAVVMVARAVESRI